MVTHTDWDLVEVAHTALGVTCFDDALILTFPSSRIMVPAESASVSDGLISVISWQIWENGHPEQVSIA